MRQSNFHGVLALACAATLAQTPAQANPRGTYLGTIQVSASEAQGNQRTTYKAEIQITMPVTGGNARRTEVEINDVTKPSATARFTEFTYENRNATPDSDGKVTSWNCKLAAPIEVPMNAQGNFDVDLAAKRYTLYVALAGLQSVPLQCVNSRSGPYKDTRAVSLFFGTSAPEVIPAEPLPLKDGARISAKHSLAPHPASQQRYSAEQSWELVFKR